MLQNNHESKEFLKMRLLKMILLKSDNIMFVKNYVVLWNVQWPYGKRVETVSKESIYLNKYVLFKISLL